MVPQCHAAPGQYLGVTIDLRGVRAVVLPGTGSDDSYVARAFGGPLRDAGAQLLAPRPQPTRLIDGYLDDLDAAARGGPIVVGGVSIGAAVAVAWAIRHPERTVAVLAALPAWTGAPDGATAAVAAEHSARQLRDEGWRRRRLRCVRPARRGWPTSWPGRGSASGRDLPDAMEQAATYVAPTHAELQRLIPPLGVAAAGDDPIHPVEVGRQWAAQRRTRRCARVTLDQIGADPAALGAACVAALEAI